MYAGGGGWLMNNKPEIFANANHLTVAFTVFIVAMALGMVNYGKIESASWFALPMPLQYGIDFVPGAIILMLFMSIVTTIETIGDISATTMGGAKREATNKELSGGIMADGVGT